MFFYFERVTELFRMKKKEGLDFSLHSDTLIWIEKNVGVSPTYQDSPLFRFSRIQIHRHVFGNGPQSNVDLSGFVIFLTLHILRLNILTTQ